MSTPIALSRDVGERNRMLSALFKRHQIAVLMMMILGILVSLGFSFLQPLEYRGGFSVLVVEKEGSLDGYAASKSAERLSTSLGQVLYTASFAKKAMEELRDTPLIHDNVLFPADETKQREQWKHHVETRIVPEVGMLHIAVYHPKREQAAQLAAAVAHVLVRDGTQYIGGQNVQLQLVNPPLASQHPVRPNFLLNAIVGLALGGIIALGFFLLRALGTEPAYQRRYDRMAGTAYPQAEQSRQTEQVVRGPIHRPQPIPKAQKKRVHRDDVVQEQSATPDERSWNYAASAAVSTEPGVWRMP